MNHTCLFHQQTRSALLSALLALATVATFSAGFAGTNDPHTATTNPVAPIPTTAGTLPRPQIWLPDLMPVGFTSTYKGTSQYFREYSATVSVANLGNKDAESFACLFGMRVLGTSNAEKYPVGSSSYVGWITFQEGVDRDDMVEKTASLGFVIPKEVTHCEIVVVTDRFLDSLANPGNWEDDAGEELTGNIQESNELNNIGSPRTFRFLNYSTTPVLKAQY